MQNGVVKSVVVLGGGTAGWLAACYLQRAFPKNLSITLVESKAVGRIGVGEATVPTMRTTLDFLGFKDEEWVPVCKAGFKNAIRFENWKNGPEKPDVYYHPFHHQRSNMLDIYGLSYFMGTEARVPLSHFWLRDKLSGRAVDDFAFATSPNPRLCETRKAPKELGTPSAALNYAYHFDAALFAGFLAEKGRERGVHHVLGDFDHAERDERGFLKSIHLKDGRKVDGDLFLDCTGFRSLLIDGVFQEKFLSQSQYLLCDSAIGTQISYTDPEKEFNPYTSAIAREFGWQWKIPLQHRYGTGYVFSSKHIDRKKAEAQLREFVGPEKFENAPLFQIDIRVGYHPRVWTKNCIAMGLAGSFLEPLESTSIFMTEFQLFQLVKHFPDLSMAPGLVAQYNRKFEECFLEIRDFIVMHYVLSKRNDTPFWRDATSRERIPPSLQEKLELFRERFPLDSDFRQHLFSAYNYTCILAGLDFLPEKPLASLAYLEQDTSAEIFQNVRKQTEELVAKLPEIRHYCEALSRG